MKKKAIFLLFISFTLATIGSVMLSSCFLENEVTICEIDFGASTDSINWGPIIHDSVIRFKDDKIAFRVFASGSEAMCYQPQFQFFSSAYATTESYIFMNQLFTPSYKLFFNKPFNFNGLEYPANTNILAVAEIYYQTTIDYSEFKGGVNSNIVFDSSLVAQMEFETEIYDVRFTCNTTDGKSFEKTTQVYFE